MEKELKEIMQNGTNEGQRTHMLFRLACSLKKQGLTNQEILKQLQEINKKNNPPLEEKEIEQICKGVDKYKFEKNPFSNFDMLTAARSFIEEYPVFYDRNRLWWRWDKEKLCWVNIDTIDILNDYEEYTNAPNLAKNSVETELINALKMVGRKNIPKEPKVKYIQFKDKVINIEDGQIYPVENRFFFTNPIPYEIGLSDETPTMDKLFSEWVGEKHVQTLYEIIAYCCYRSYPIQLIFCFVGGGRNGKTQFQKILYKFLGSNNMCASELDRLLENRFESFKLYKKLACVMGETNFGVMSNTSLLKKLSGGDLIGYEKKNADPFDAYNYSKILINSNSMPTSQDTSDGFYRRWVILDFPNQFKEGKDIVETIPEIEYNNLANKIIKILPLLLDRGSFTNQGSIEERKQKYIEVSNPLMLFLDLACERDPDGWVRDTQLYTAYTFYLNERKRRVVSKKEFYDALSVEGLEKRRTTKMTKEVGSNGYPINEYGYFFDGLRLKDDWRILCKKCNLCSTFHLIPPTRKMSSESLHKLHFLHESEEQVYVNNSSGDILKLISQNGCFAKDSLENIYGVEVIQDLIKKGEIFENPVGMLRLLP